MKLRLTNKLDLPAPIVHAMLNDSYSSGRSDYTVTGLLKPARAVQLAKDNIIVEDAGDRLYALQGQSMHHILERAGNELQQEGYVVEKRFYHTYAVGVKLVTIGAQIDLFDPAKGILQDYKYTSMFTFTQDLKEEHRIQLSVQAEFLRIAGFQVDKAEVVLMARDWRKMQALQDESYPQSPFKKVLVPLMSSSEVTKWIVERVEAMQKAQEVLPECTSKEKWSRPSTFAVMKTSDAFKATRVFDTQKEAEAYITAKAPTSIVVERKGEDVNCLAWCPARFVCEHGKKVQEKLLTKL